ncbi:ParB/RepB/Spo0J family partition protein [Patescibacteria group bacterium]|nr:ParB/RepB/Spo0J family partition protein [Patescibacteria group bacterium]
MSYSLGKGLSSLIPEKNNVSDESVETRDILIFQDTLTEPVHILGDHRSGASPAARVVEEPAPIVRKAIVIHEKKVEPVRKDENSIFWIEIEKIEPNPFQPRREFDEGALESLAHSIREYGILQPLLVYKIEIESSRGISVKYQLIAGERRWRAAKLAGLREVPVIIRKDDHSDRIKLELALIENVQREDLNAIDRASAFKQLIDDFYLTQKEVAERIGKSREFVTNTLRLLTLPEQIQEIIRSGEISEGHGRASLMLSDQPEKQKELIQEIREGHLNVREAEFAARAILGHRRVPQRKDVALLDHDERHWQRQLEQTLGTRVSLQKQGEKGKIIVEFYSDEELQSILDKIVRQE